MSSNATQSPSRLQNVLADRSTVLKAVEFTVLLAMNIMALSGNVLICIVVYRRSTLRTIANMFIVALAITDILMALLPMPLSLAALLVNDWPFGEVVCQFQGFIIYLLAFQSLQLITLTAVNRNIHVMRSALHKRVFTPKKTWLMISFTVAFSAVVIGALMTGLPTYFAFHPGKVFCSVVMPSLECGFIFTGVFGFFFVVLPICVIGICYVRILRAIRMHRKEYRSAQGEHDSDSVLSREAIKLSRIVLVIVLGFAICWIPCVIIDTVDTMQASYHPRQVYLLYTYLGYGSSMINPWIYGGLNKQVRREIVSLLFQRRQHTEDAVAPPNDQDDQA